MPRTARAASTGTRSRCLRESAGTRRPGPPSALATSPRRSAPAGAAREAVHVPRVRRRGVAFPVDDQVAALGDLAQRRRDGADGLHGGVRPARAAVVRGVDDRPSRSAISTASAWASTVARSNPITSGARAVRSSAAACSTAPLDRRGERRDLPDARPARTAPPAGTAATGRQCGRPRPSAARSSHAQPHAVQTKSRISGDRPCQFGRHSVRQESLATCAPRSNVAAGLQDAGKRDDQSQRQVNHQQQPPPKHDDRRRIEESEGLDGQPHEGDASERDRQRSQGRTSSSKPRTTAATVIVISSSFSRDTRT